MTLNGAAPADRRDALIASLVLAVDLLKRREAKLIGDELIAELVALDWIEWNGGSLRLTAVGQNLWREAVRVAQPPIDDE